MFGWEEEGERKVVGPTSFLSFPFKIQSLQIGEKIRVKSGKNIWTKLPPPLLTFLAPFFFLFSFFFWLFLCNAGFWFFVFVFFFFSCFFLWFCQVVGSSSFFLIYIFIIFFKKTFLDDFLYYFWNVHFHLYTILKKSIMYYFLFYLRGTWW